MEILVEYFLLVLALVLVPAGATSVVLGVIRERRKVVVLGVCSILAATLLLLRTQYSVFWMVDECLDSGGRVNYAESNCEHR